MSLTTTAHIASWPFLVLGSPTTKAQVTSSHFQVGTLWSYVLSRWCLNFTYWHVKHLKMNSATSFSIPGHQYILFKSWYILVAPEWIVYYEWWVSCRISLLNSSFLGTHSWPFYLITSSSPFLIKLREVRNPYSSSSIPWAILIRSTKSLEIVISKKRIQFAYQIHLNDIFHHSQLSHHHTENLACRFLLSPSGTTFVFPEW